MHPVTYRKVVSDIGSGQIPMGGLADVPIYVNEHMPIWNQKWQFPDDPFVEYEKSDEKWARPIGYGRSVDDIGNHCIMAMYDWRLRAIAMV